MCFPFSSPKFYFLSGIPLIPKSVKVKPAQITFHILILAYIVNLLYNLITCGHATFISAYGIIRLVRCYAIMIGFDGTVSAKERKEQINMKKFVIAFPCTSNSLCPRNLKAWLYANYFPISFNQNHYIFLERTNQGFAL